MPTIRRVWIKLAGHMLLVVMWRHFVVEPVINVLLARKIVRVRKWWDNGSQLGTQILGFEMSVLCHAK